MSVKRPTPQQIEEIAASLGMSLSDADIAFYAPFLKRGCDAFDVLERLSLRFFAKGPSPAALRGGKRLPRE